MNSLPIYQALWNVTDILLCIIYLVYLIPILIFNSNYFTRNGIFNFILRKNEKKINHNITKTLQWISVCYSTTNQRTMEGDKVLLYFFYNIFKDYQTNVIWLKFSEVITALQFEKIFLHIFLGRYMINSQSYFSKVW